MKKDLTYTQKVIEDYLEQNSVKKITIINAPQTVKIKPKQTKSRLFLEGCLFLALGVLFVSIVLL